jgi:RimJ/RimL family protein N-acetyltransferase
MNMKTTYTCLNKQIYTDAEFSLVPIRWEDRCEIMQWRNEQIFHLRQNKKLTIEEQDAYFENVISKLFDQEQPEQILFSMLQGETCIAYGGLVHINWKDKNAEVSFLMDTELEKTQFNNLWSLYLSMIEEMAFQYLDLNEIYTYSYEVRPQLYIVLDKAGYTEKERISSAIKINNNPVDAIIHFKRSSELSYRTVQYSDAELLFNWANDSSTRSNSLSSKKITWEEHMNWFNQKMNDPKTTMFLFLKKETVGVLRLDKVNNNLQISFSVNFKHRGKGVGNNMIRFILKKFSRSDFSAQVIENNLGSHRIFLRNNFMIDYISSSGSKKVTHYIKKAVYENN